MDISTTPAPQCPRAEAYARFLADAATTPFAWGSWDCVTFAAAAVHALTGVDHLSGLAAWNGPLEAARLLRDLGGLRAAVTSRLGEPFLPGLACAGDVVLTTDPNADDGRELLAVCHGPYLIAPGATGLCVLPLTSGICAWRPANV